MTMTIKMKTRMQKSSIYETANDDDDNMKLFVNLSVIKAKGRDLYAVILVKSLALIFLPKLSAYLPCYVHLGSVCPVIIQLVFFESAGSSLSLSLVRPACVKAGQLRGCVCSQAWPGFLIFFLSLSYIFF